MSYLTGEREVNKWKLELTICLRVRLWKTENIQLLNTTAFISTSTLCDLLNDLVHLATCLFHYLRQHSGGWVYRPLVEALVFAVPYLLSVEWAELPHRSLCRAPSLCSMSMSQICSGLNTLPHPNHPHPLTPSSSHKHTSLYLRDGVANTVGLITSSTSIFIIMLNNTVLIRC